MNNYYRMRYYCECSLRRSIQGCFCVFLSTSLGAVARLQVELLVVACSMVREEEEEEGEGGYRPVPLLFPPPSP